MDTSLFISSIAAISLTLLVSFTASTPTCLFRDGDAVSSKYLDLGTKSTFQECIKSCEEKKVYHPDINGVSVTMSGTIKCICAKGMTGWKVNDGWKACLTEPVHGAFSVWSDWSVCSASCGSGKQHRTRLCNNPPALNGGKECNSTRSEERVCNSRLCPNVLCTFLPGQGLSLSRINVGGKVTLAECIMACEDQKVYYPDINGVSIPNDGSKSYCYCERNMRDRDASTSYKSCFTEPIDGGFSVWSDWSVCSASCNGGKQYRKRNCNNPTPMNGGRECNGTTAQEQSCHMRKCPSVNCKFLPGNGYGLSELNVGAKATAADCILACEDKKVYYPDINGVSIPSSGAITYCFCERRMRKRDTSTSIKSCFTEPVNGGFSVWSDWSVCSSSCGDGTHERKRNCNNPTPSNGGKDCHGDDTQYRACHIRKCPTVDCHFLPGDGVGLTSISVGTKTTVTECIMSCEDKKAYFPDINGVSLPASGSMSCYCERRMTKRNGDKSWKSCFTEPVNGGLSPWSEWSMCSATCNGGYQVRSKLCNNPIPLYGGTNCTGKSIERRECNNRICKDWKCTFKAGDFTGSKINLGQKISDDDCVQSCKELKFLKRPEINGVTVTSSGNTYCYCNLGGSGSVNTNSNYKTCTLL